MATTMLRQVSSSCVKLRSLCHHGNTTPVLYTSVRHRKHYDPKWRKERGRKFLKVDLPDYEEIRNQAKLNPDELRAKMKKEGRLPPQQFNERPINLASTGGVFEPYVPPEGDGKASLVSTVGAKQKFTQLEKKGKSYLQVRKIRELDDDFDVNTFADIAQDIYVKAHTLLQDIETNEDELHDIVTELAFPKLTEGIKQKTFRWRIMESVEPPRVVHVRQTDLLSKENVYGQVTVRMHIKQTLAIYDRFGRLQYGSEHLAKNCIEYVVFEKHLSNIYGKWRIHGKVVPDWMPPRETILRTSRIPDLSSDKEENESASTAAASN